jgi:hypothetical protein
VHVEPVIPGQVQDDGERERDEDVGDSEVHKARPD